MTIIFENGSKIETIDTTENVRDRLKEFPDIYEIIDDVGGIHSEGMGWSPDGTFCGECCDIDCSTCSGYTKIKPPYIDKKRQ